MKRFPTNFELCNGLKLPWTVSLANLKCIPLHIFTYNLSHNLFTLQRCHNIEGLKDGHGRICFKNMVFVKLGNKLLINVFSSLGMGFANWDVDKMSDCANKKLVNVWTFSKNLLRSPKINQEIKREYPQSLCCSLWLS